jgi:hypothetical protein
VGETREEHMRRGLTWALLASQLTGCCISFGSDDDAFGDPSVRTPLPEDLTTGEWRDPTHIDRRSTVLDIYDVENQEWMSIPESNEKAGSGFRFYPDGRYVRASYITIRNGICVSHAWDYQQGGVALADSTTLTLHPAVHRQQYEGGCNSASNMDRDVPLEPQTYSIGIQPEGEDTFLYLQLGDTTRKYIRQ